MKYIALIACCIFMWYALRREQRLRPFSSLALWIPTLWMLRCASRSLNYWFNGTGVEALTSLQAGTEERGYYDVVFLSILILAGLIALARRRVGWNQIFRENAWLFLFVAYMAASTLWAPEPAVSGKRFIRTAGDFIMALITMTEGRPLEAFVTVIRRTAVFFVPLCVLVCKYFPDNGRLQSKSWAVSDSWIGISTHKNSMTAFLMVVAACIIWQMRAAKRGEEDQSMELPRRRWFSMETVYLLMIAYLMLNPRSRSTTALAGLAAICIIMYLFERVKGDRRRWLLNICGVGVVFLLGQGICLLLTGTSLSSMLLILQGKSLDLTGRTEYWPVLINMGLDHPFLGAGYGGFWTAGTMEHFLKISTWGFLPEAHNGYLETFLNLGLVGLGFLFIIIVKAIAASWRSLVFDPSFGILRLALLVSILIHNFAEATFSRENHTLWIIFFMLAYNPPADLEESDDILIAETEWDESEHPAEAAQDQQP